MTTSTIISEAGLTFMKFVRAKQLATLIRQDTGIPAPVYISMEEIEDRFFKFPKYNRKEELQKLTDRGELSITKKLNSNGRVVNLYSALLSGTFDLSLVKPKKQSLDEVTEKMKSFLRLVSLPGGAPSTSYFDLFLKHGKAYIDLFFRQDDFSKRIHTPVTNFHRTHRPNILLDGERTTSFDVVTMQPLLLGKILKVAIGENEFSNWISSGKDIYIMLQEKAELKTRDEAKKLFFEILFSYPNEKLNLSFGNSKWINYINWYKKNIDPRNPHGAIKGHHTNLAWALQNMEVQLMKKIWTRLVNENIIFLSVHDEIIVQIKHQEKAEGIMMEVLAKELEYFRLNKQIIEKQPNEQEIVLKKMILKNPSLSKLIETFDLEIKP